MASVKLTKNELKNQKDRLEQFERYLPTLQLKQQQLQSVMMQLDAQCGELEKRRERAISGLSHWIAVYSENTSFDEERRLENLVVPDNVVCAEENIAGVTVPVFRELTFRDIDYEPEDYPLWVDTGIQKLKDIAEIDARLKVLAISRQRLGDELRVTSQRVNLFEKVKIPETRENIRVIGIYLGDQQTSAVVRGKIAKKKLQVSP